MANRPEIKDKFKETVVNRFVNAISFDQANWLIEQINQFDKLSPEQIKLLEEAPKKNGQVRGAWKVENMLPGVIIKFKGAMQ